MRPETADPQPMNPSRRAVLTLPALTVPTARLSAACPAAPVGVTNTELRIGNTMPYSGPVSAFGVIGRCEAAFFRMVNEQGGIAGRQITFISYDDGYSPPRTVEQVRRLLDHDQVAFLFNTFGTACNAAVVRYVNQRGVPHLFLGSGADRWSDFLTTPWTMGWQPSYRTEGRIYAKHIQTSQPGARVALLYQNDDFGKDYALGLRDVFGEQFGSIVQTASYEVTDASIDSQILSLRAGGATVLLTAAGPKHAALALRKVSELDWHPLHFLANPSTSAAGVMNVAGSERAAGVITAGYLKDPTDPAWRDDPGMAQWRSFMQRYLPGADMADGAYLYGYGVCLTLLQVLRQCGGDFCRENLMRQAASLHDFEIPVLLPGIRVRTTAQSYRPIRQMQLSRWNGSTWQRFGQPIESS
jgi:branched-chain amino acid transport system substrate-binding protein